MIIDRYTKVKQLSNLYLLIDLGDCTWEEAVLKTLCSALVYYSGGRFL